MATVTEHRTSSITNIHINTFVLKSKKNEPYEEKTKQTNQRTNQFRMQQENKWAERGRTNTEWVKADSIRATLCIQYICICLYVILANTLRSRVRIRAHAQICICKPSNSQADQ